MIVNDLELRVHRDVRSIEKVLPDWSALWTRCAGVTTFQRPEWIFTWMQTFQPSEPLLIEVRQSDNLVGIAPLLIYQRGPERVVGFMSGGVSDYLDILLDPCVSQRALAAIWKYLNECGSSWDLLELCDLPVSSQTLHIRAIADGAEQSQHEECTELSLSPSTIDRSKSDMLHGIVPPHKLENLKNARARLKRVGADLEMTPQIELATSETLPIFLDRLCEFRSQRWFRNEVNQSAHETTGLFYRRALAQLHEIGVLRVYGLRIAGSLVAVLSTFFEPNVAYFYLQGFDSEYSSVSPGNQLLGRAIEDAMGEKKSKADFLRGRESYKYSWGVKDSATYRIRAPRDGRRAAVDNKDHHHRVA